MVGRQSQRKTDALRLVQDASMRLHLLFPLSVMSALHRVDVRRLRLHAQRLAARGVAALALRSGSSGLGTIDPIEMSAPASANGVGGEERRRHKHRSGRPPADAPAARVDLLSA